jgi:hypothetical protein
MCEAGTRSRRMKLVASRLPWMTSSPAVVDVCMDTTPFSLISSTLSDSSSIRLHLSVSTPPMVPSDGPSSGTSSSCSTSAVR